MNIASGATLGFREGASVSGAVTFSDGAILAPEFADAASFPCISFGSAPTVVGIVKVKLPEGVKYPVGASYALTSGAGLSDASSFALADGVRGMLSVDGGELVYTAPGFFIKVR